MREKLENPRENRSCRRFDLPRLLMDSAESTVAKPKADFLGFSVGDASDAEADSSGFPAVHTIADLTVSLVDFL